MTIYNTLKTDTSLIHTLIDGYVLQIYDKGKYNPGLFTRYIDQFLEAHDVPKDEYEYWPVETTSGGEKYVDSYYVQLTEEHWTRLLNEENAITLAVDPLKSTTYAKYKEHVVREFESNGIDHVVGYSTHWSSGGADRRCIVQELLEFDVPRKYISEVRHRSQSKINNLDGGWEVSIFDFETYIMLKMQMTC